MIYSLAFEILLSCASAQHPNKTLRWSEGEPGCTFSADDDGRYRYGLWTRDFGLVLAVDALELQKTLRRAEPVFEVHMTVHYRDKNPLAVDPAVFTLEFVDHSQTVQPALNPEDLIERLQADSGAFTAKTEHTLHKHPEKKEALDAELQSFQKNIADTQQFIRSRTVRSATLDVSHPEAEGWVLFSANNKWIGQWKKQERFVLRVPIAGQTIEFPFALPPSRGDVLLRRRP